MRNIFVNSFCALVDSGVVILKDSDEGPLLAELGQDLSLFCNYQVGEGSRK